MFSKVKIVRNNNERCRDDNMKRLGGKVAIVTASAGAGIRRTDMRRLTQENAKVVVTDIHERWAAEVAEDTKAEGFEAIGASRDAADSERAASGTDILESNVSRNVVTPITEMDDELWNTVIDADLEVSPMERGSKPEEVVSRQVKLDASQERPSASAAVRYIH